MRSQNKPMVTNQPLNASFKSQAMLINEADGYYIGAVITGIPLGQVKLQSSGWGIQGTPPDNSFTDIPCSTFSLTAEEPISWNVGRARYSWVRMVFTDLSSGASVATMTAYINSKGDIEV